MLPEKESMTVIIGVSAAINFSVTLKTETRSVIVSVRKADIIIMIIKENTSSIIPYSFFSLISITSFNYPIFIQKLLHTLIFYKYLQLPMIFVNKYYIKAKNIGSI